jgi:hypothetical protein
MVSTIYLLGPKNFLQADLLSGNLVPRFHHFLHLWAVVPIARRGIQAKQIISKSYNTYRNSTIGTNEGSHQEPREAPNGSGENSEEDKKLTIRYSRIGRKKRKLGCQ